MENLGLVEWIKKMFKLHSSNNLFCTSVFDEGNTRQLDILRYDYSTKKYQPIFRCVINNEGNMKSGDFYIDYLPNELWDMIHNDSSTRHNFKKLY